MKNILVLMHQDVGQEARFQAALDLTRAVDGHLTCVDVAIAPLFIGEYTQFGGAALLMADEQQRERENREHMEARLSVEGVSYDWIDHCGVLSDAVLDSVGLADLIVLNRELDSVAYPEMRELVGDVLLKAHKPIVAVPQHTKQFDVSGHALIAWDGSSQAEAALREATPLLEKASTVSILQVDDGSVKVDAVEAAAYLSHYGIKAVVRYEDPDFRLPSILMLDMINQLGAAYLVMGGFGHSRFMEAAFGGVTKRMLKECPVPLFLAH